MQKIKSSIIIGNAIIEINKKVISFKEIIDYYKNINEKLKNTDYYLEVVNYENILKFSSSYCIFIDEVKNDSIVINNKSKDKLNKYFKGQIPKELIHIFSEKYKYILPVLIDNELFNYYLILNKTLDHNFTSTNGGEYIIDLSKLIMDYELEEIFNNGEIVLKNSITNNNLYKFLKNFEYINNSNNIQNFFEVKELKKIYNYYKDKINDYKNVALNNKKILDQCRIDINTKEKINIKTK